MNLYPLLMAPAFRYGKATPWGGHMLRDVFMKDAPDNTGESLEVSTLEGLESMVANGAHAGKSLTRMVELWGDQLTGPIQGGFPLVLKLLDAQEPSSVHVHPDEDYARAHGGARGKNEGLVILNAEPGAKMVYGLKTDGESLKSILDSDAVGEHLRWVNVQPGDVYYIPAGMVHALGSEIQCYELQDACDITYRLYDWDRTDKDGKPRERHPEQALAVTDPDLALFKNEGTTVLRKGGSVTYYISNTHFEFCRLNLSGKMPLPSGRMLLLTPLGECALHWGEEQMTLAPFSTVIVPAALEGAVIEGNTKVLMSSLPDRDALREELGYRAENVAGLMD